MKIFILTLILVISQEYAALGASITAVGVAGVTSVIGAPLKILLTAFQAVRAGKDIVRCMSSCISSIKQTELWTATKKSIDDREKAEEEEEELLLSQPELCATQDESIAKALYYAIILYAPLSKPYERIEAIFTLNALTILGPKGRFFRKYLASRNYHYFDRDGNWKGYVPFLSFETPQDSRSLITFLKMMCPCKHQYMEYLKLGIKRGITSFEDRYQRDQQKEWYPKSESMLFSYAKGIVKHALGFDIGSLRRVQQSMVLAKNSNQLFFEIIKHCSNENGDRKKDFEKAKEVLERYRHYHHSVACPTYEGMMRYYNERFGYYQHHLRRQGSRI